MKTNNSLLAPDAEQTELLPEEISAALGALRHHIGLGGQLEKSKNN